MEITQVLSAAGAGAIEGCSPHHGLLRSVVSAVVIVFGLAQAARQEPRALGKKFILVIAGGMVGSGAMLVGMFFQACAGALLGVAIREAGGQYSDLSNEPLELIGFLGAIMGFIGTTKAIGTVAAEWRERFPEAIDGLFAELHELTERLLQN